MQIYLMRHGIAEDPVPGRRDADRPLTPEGRKKLRALIKRARAAGAAPTLILSSPFLRARESAEAAAAGFGYTGDILYTQALEPGANPEQVWEEIGIHKDETQILLSGHEPLLSRIAAYLLNSPNLEVDFKKGALLRIDLNQAGSRPRGILKWMLVAKLV